MAKVKSLKKGKKTAAKKAASKSTTVKSANTKKVTAKTKSVSKAKAPSPKKAAPKATKKPVKKTVAVKAKKASAPSKKAMKPVASATKTTNKTTAKAKAAAKPVAAKKATPAKSAKAASIHQLFTPLDNRVIIQLQGVSDRTPGGLYIPDMVQERPNQGQVVAVGPGHRDAKGRFHPLDVQLGDVVMFGRHAGTEFALSEQNDLLLLREDEILAVVKS